MPVPRSARLAILVGILAACTTGPVEPPPAAVPPVVTFDTRIKDDTLTVTSVVAAQGEALTDHRLVLNGVVVRSGPVSVWTLQDTILPGGAYTLSGVATTSAGTGQRDFVFLIREKVPPAAQDRTFDTEEAGSFSLNMVSVTSGEADRQYAFDTPPTLALERFGASTIRVRAAAAGAVPADDVHGLIALPYTVTDRNGSDSGVLQFNFRPQPDITITEVRFLTGIPDTGSVRISLNGESHFFRTGTRVQGRVGENIWSVWNQVPLASLAVLLVEGQGEAVPLNLNLLAETMTFGPDDLTAELWILGTTYPGLDAACRGQFEAGYGRVRADTVASVDFIVMTQAAAGREQIEVGGESFLRWREAFDSLVAEEGRRASQMNRTPRSFTFTTDVETEPRVDGGTFPPPPAGQPAAGQVWIYDSLVPTVTAGIATGGAFYTGVAGDVLSGSAWSTPVAPVPNRRVALAKWFDRRMVLEGGVFFCSRHRNTYGPDEVNPASPPVEATLLPLLQSLADWLIRNRGLGFLQLN